MALWMKAVAIGLGFMLSLTAIVSGSIWLFQNHPEIANMAFGVLAFLFFTAMVTAFAHDMLKQTVRK